MKHSQRMLRLVVMAMMIALGVVISPIIRVEGMCPMAHFINILCAVLLGPVESLICAVIIGILRMALMGIPPLALTGAIFGAFLSGVLYRFSKGSLFMAVLGEIVGTGIIGAIASYPVMTLLWGKEGLSWLFYVPSFVCGTLIGGSLAFAFLRKLVTSGMLTKLQAKFGSPVYNSETGMIGSAVSIASIGVICFVVIELAGGSFGWNMQIVSYIAKGMLILFPTVAVLYLGVKIIGAKHKNSVQ